MASRTKLRSLFWLSVALVCLIPTTVPAAFYSVFPIDYPGASIVYVRGINNRGDVVGTAGSTGQWVPYLQTSDGVFQDIGTYGGYYGAGGAGINERGDIIIGLSWEGIGYIRTGSGELIPMPDDVPGLLPTSINDRRQVLASGVFSGGMMSGFIWDSVRDTRTLLDPSESYYSQPFDMNNAMWAVGDAWVPGGVKRAFLSTPRRSMQLLESLEDGESHAYGINERGMVVGAVKKPGGQFGEYFPAWWDRRQRLHLIAPQGELTGTASAINNAGHIVGDGARYPSGAFIFRDGVFSYLDELVPPDSAWQFTAAEGINDRGCIIARGRLGNTGKLQALLLVPPLELSCGPLVRGRAVELQVSGVETGDIVLFFMGFSGLGDGPCYQRFQFCLDLLDPLFIGIGRGDRFGVASIRRSVPGRARIVTAHFQAVVLHGGEWLVLDPISRVVTRELGEHSRAVQPSPTR